jgi:hypothetical protein
MYVFTKMYTHTYKPLTLYPRRDSRDISDISHENDLAMSNTADVTLECLSPSGRSRRVVILDRRDER